MTPDTLQVVHFYDLPHAQGLMLEDVSYGDAVFTLVLPQQIIDELRPRVFGQADPLNELITALAAIPNGVLVALEG